MKSETKTAILVGIIIALVAYIFFTLNEVDKGETKTTDIDTIYIQKNDSFYFPAPYPVYVSKPDIPEKVDTTAIINDYYSRKIYSELLINTENLKLSLSDTVFQNSLLGRNLNYELTFPEITKTVTITKKPVFSVSLLLDSRPSASALVGYKYFFIQGGYNLQEKQPFVGLGVKLFER